MGFGAVADAAFSRSLHLMAGKPHVSHAVEAIEAVQCARVAEEIAI